jgi:hypothetical protein
VQYREGRRSIEQCQREIADLLGTISRDSKDNTLLFPEDVLFSPCRKFQMKAPSELIREGRFLEAYQATRINIVHLWGFEPKEISARIKSLQNNAR